MPGDLLGLAGPSAFNVEVVEAGEAVVLDGADLGLVPHRAGAGVVWRCHQAVSTASCPTRRRPTGRCGWRCCETTEVLGDLDVARWRPEVADELMALRRHADFTFPDDMAPRAVRLAALSTRCRTIVDLALEDDGGSVTAAEADARRRALAPLDHAARRGLVAACTYPWER